MNQVHDKIHEMDVKLTDHIRDETEVLAEEVSKIMLRAFPAGDPDGHRKDHEYRMQLAKDRAEFWKKMLFEISKWGLVGFLGFAAIAVWKHFLEGPK